MKKILLENALNKPIALELKFGKQYMFIDQMSKTLATIMHLNTKGIFIV